MVGPISCSSVSYTMVQSQLVMTGVVSRSTTHTKKVENLDVIKIYKHVRIYSVSISPILFVLVKALLPVSFVPSPLGGRSPPNIRLPLFPPKSLVRGWLQGQLEYTTRIIEHKCGFETNKAQGKAKCLIRPRDHKYTLQGPLQTRGTPSKKFYDAQAVLSQARPQWVGTLML